MSKDKPKYIIGIDTYKSVKSHKARKLKDEEITNCTIVVYNSDGSHEINITTESKSPDNYKEMIALISTYYKDAIILKEKL